MKKIYVIIISKAETVSLRAAYNAVETAQSAGCFTITTVNCAAKQRFRLRWSSKRCFDIIYVIIKCNLGVAQVVARYLGVVEAVGSSPVTQTRLSLDAIRVRTLSFYGMFLHSGECLSVKSPKMILKLA